MAWSSAVLRADEGTNLLADQPLIATQAIPVSLDAVEWSAAGSFAGADATTTGFPARRAYDGKGGLWTKPSGAAVTWYYLMSFASAPIEFDCAFIIGHNLGTLSVTTVQIEIADDSAFAVNLQVVADFGAPADDLRLNDLLLKHVGAVALRYSDVPYARLKLAGPSVRPQIGEIILGRRRQLKTYPMVGFDKDGLHNNTSVATSSGGVRSKVVHSRGRFDLMGTVQIHEDNYINDMIGFAQDCRGPMVWMENPNSAPASWHFMDLDTDDLEFPSSGFTERQFELVAVEQGPEEYYLSKGLR